MAGTGVFVYVMTWNGKGAEESGSIMQVYNSMEKASKAREAEIREIVEESGRYTREEAEEIISIEPWEVQG